MASPLRSMNPIFEIFSLKPKIIEHNSLDEHVDIASNQTDLKKISVQMTGSSLLDSVKGLKKCREDIDSRLDI